MTELEKNINSLSDFYTKKTSSVNISQIENSLISILEEDAEVNYQKDKEDPDNYYGSGDDPEYLKKAAIDLIKQTVRYLSKK